MRPSSISFERVSFATSRRMPSNDESTTACGVSSMMTSTPVRCSSARMLRPSRPMIRPFMSSEGSSISETVVSDGVARGHTLEGVGDEVAGAALRLGARLLLGLPHLAGELVADELLGSVEQVRLGLVDGHARDALELGHLRVARLLEVFLELLGMHLAVEDALLAPRELGQLLVDVLFLGQHALLDLENLRAPLGDLLLDLGS